MFILINACMWQRQNIYLSTYLPISLLSIHQVCSMQRDFIIGGNEERKAVRLQYNPDKLVAHSLN